jgi:dTDP-4-amino-4,6-dideoxygalactose transaminase
MADPGRDFIPFAVPDIGEDEVAAAAEAIRSGWLTTGKQSASFEREFAEFLRPGLHAIAVNSATAGLHLALEAAGVGPGDEVIVPTWTFTATAEVVRYLGADPVPVDVHPDTLNIDLAAAAAAVTSRTKAMIPVHFAGLPVPAGALAGCARSNGLRVIEDAAHSFPARSEGEVVGTGASDAVVFSFYATKTMTTGEGGMVVTEDDALASRARTMRLHGINRDVFDRYTSTVPSWRYEVVAPGFKYNLTDPAAAIGRVQLRRAAAMRQRREQIAEAYFAGLADLPLQLPMRALPEDLHAWHLYVLRLGPDASLGRDRFIERMSEEGVGCSVHFIPLHLHPYWRDRYQLTPEAFPVASREFEHAVSLPIFSSMTDAQVSRVIEVAHKVLG